MSKKRTSTESSNDEQTKEDDSGLFQEGDGAKRAKLTTAFSDTTLQDLPIEILEQILVKAVALEVKGLKLAKNVRKEKAYDVAGRLRTVCSQWDSILTTNFFWKELDKTLDCTGKESIRLEVLQQPSFPSKVIKMTTLRDEIFMLCNSLDGSEKVINVYDRDNMEEEKDVMHLPGISPGDMAAGSVSNCVYILDRERFCPSVFRITRDGQHRFKMSPWISDLRLAVTNRGPMSVSANGNLIVLSGRKGAGFKAMFQADSQIYRSEYPGIYIYAANGSLLHEIMFNPDITGPRIIKSVIQKSNGNLVLLSLNDDYKAKLLEIDSTGAIVRQYQSSLHECSVVSFADVHGRILINDERNSFELLDAEFNPLEIAVPQLFVGHTCNPPQLHFDGERNEMMRVEMYKCDALTFIPHTTVFSIFRLTEE